MALKDRYEILGPLGEGGMSRVYRARDANLAREVAIKIPRPEVLADPDSAERFRREARASASLTHPNIVRIYDFVDDPEEPHLVMELIVGEDLRRLIDRVGALEVGTAVQYARQILSAVASAHDRGVVHRDLSARNVLLEGETGQARVSDFGIARAMGDGTLTPTGKMIGSVSYISPEQARGDAIGPASDIYSAGCLLYEMVTGRLPFSGDNPVQIALKHVQEEPVPPDRWRADLPSSLVSIILKAMAKAPTDRFGSAREMEQALSHVPKSSEVEPTRMRSVVGRGSSGEFPRPDEFRTRKIEPEALPPHPAERRGGWPAGLLALLVMILFGVFLLQPPRIEVPDLAGLPVGEAQTQLVRLGLKARLENSSGPGKPGTVTGQVPAPGTRLRHGEEVSLMVVAAPETVEVPDLRGLTLDTAKSELEKLKLALKIRQVPDEAGPEGVVKEQTPQPGSKVEPDSSIELGVSAPAPKASIPELVGMSSQQARSALQTVGMDLLISNYRFDASAPPDTVLEQTPSAGARATPQGRVRVVLSRGSKGMNVPQLEGKTVQEARKIADGLGVELVVEGGGNPGDTITMQEPPAGDPVTGAQIVVRTAQTTVVPTVQGLGQQDATARILAAGLKVGRVTTVYSDTGGFVVSQDPLPGIEVAPGTRVELSVGDPNAAPPPDLTPVPPPLQPEPIETGGPPAPPTLPPPPPTPAITVP